MILWFWFFTISSDTLGLVMAWWLYSELVQGSFVASGVQEISLNTFSIHSTSYFTIPDGA